ncbi:MAG: hypothetical protein DRH37_08525 [Deltaproteobacteria bacterium]|nr:MAG: hypothetical protein DRH37_08525 [Deltaproteobacteria bacterium]
MHSLSAVHKAQAGIQTGAAYRMYASASSLDFPGLAQQFAFPDRKLTRAPNFIYGWSQKRKRIILIHTVSHRLVLSTLK